MRSGSACRWRRRGDRLRRSRRRSSSGETELPGAKVSAVTRKHGIVTGLLFRWRAQFGIAQKKRSKLARVVLADDMFAARALRDLVRPPEGMMAIDLGNGLRVFAPAGSDPDAVRAQIDSDEAAQ
ncbi:transposase [Bradyrhizobium sp. SZCCHNPS2010]|uniref:transposase n=1 Tax=Bradyrhizobium sp. SZCCHNPS2010 TaxID=3057333 RepID=UPI00291604BF|nr:transposase [Bradyrhizobium sp. SZCCHNPS2010]